MGKPTDHDPKAITAVSYGGGMIQGSSGLAIPVKNLTEMMRQQEAEKDRDNQ